MDKNISHTTQCIFIHVPKTGGTSIEDVLFNKRGRHSVHLTAQILKQAHPNLWEEYTTIAFVRNPYDRLVSLYHYYCDYRSKSFLPEIRYARQFVRAFPTFTHFIHRAFTHRLIQQKAYMFQLQVDYLTPMPDIVGRFECLTRDLRYICDCLGIPNNRRPVPTLRTSRHQHFTTYYTTALADVVYTHYQRDFEQFHYARKSWRLPTSSFNTARLFSIPDGKAIVSMLHQKATPQRITFALAGWFTRTDGPITVDHIVGVFTTALKHAYPTCQIDVVKQPKPNIQYDVLLCSVFQRGDKVKPLRQYNAKVKIMFSAENALRFRLQAATQYCDYFVGFTGGLVTSKRCRLVTFPNWMYYWDFMDDHSQALEYVRSHVPTLRDFATRHKKTCFIAMNPNGGKRVAMVRSLRALGRPVDCPGKVCNNMPSVERQTGIALKRKAKLVFLKRYVLNLCPENSPCPGYMTEKIMQACMTDCIPIYFSEQNLVPGILNKKRILFCPQLNTIGTAAQKTLRTLFSDNKAFEAFYMQPVFASTAVERIINLRDGFRAMMREVGERLRLTDPVS